jgi:hypothetical protein
MRNLEDSKEYKDLTNRRYHTWSDFDYTKEDNIKMFKMLLAVMILRELPLRHFYARCFVVGAALYYMNYQWWWIYGRKPVY